MYDRQHVLHLQIFLGVQSDQGQILCTLQLDQDLLNVASVKGENVRSLTLSGPGGGGLRGPDGQTHSCQSETSYPMMPKLGDF